jgi:hypothetical protein
MSRCLFLQQLQRLATARIQRQVASCAQILSEGQGCEIPCGVAGLPLLFKFGEVLDNGCKIAAALNCTYLEAISDPTQGGQKPGG